MDKTFEAISLCKAYKNAKEELRLFRLADLIDDELIPLEIDKTKDTVFKNRDRLYFSYSDNPNVEENDINLWSWTASPKADSPDEDFVKSKIEYEYSPYHFIELEGLTSLEDFKLYIDKTEIYNNPYNCDTIFGYKINTKQYVGLLCKKNEFHFENKKIVLNPDITSLPIFKISEDNLITVNDKNERFIKYFKTLGFVNYFFLKNKLTIIKDLFLKHITNKYLQENIGGTKNDWANCKEILRKMTETTLYDEISETLKCKKSEATKLLNNYLDDLSSTIEQNDIEKNVLKNIIYSNEELYKQSEDIISETWNKEHEALKEECKKEIQELNEQINNINRKKEALKNEIKNLKDKKQKTIDDAKKYEEIKLQTIEAIENKYEETKKNIPELIANYSILPSSINNNSLQKWYADSPSLPDIDPDLFHDECKTFDEVFDLLNSNLINYAGVKGELSNILSVLLYSAYTNKTDLLLAGPNAKEIAESISFAIEGKVPKILNCYGEFNSELITELKQSDENIIIIENPFNKDWIDSLPLKNIEDKLIIWTYPYTEDLSIEPFSLFNYVLPIFTDIFVEREACLTQLILQKKTSECSNFEITHQLIRETQEKYKKDFHDFKKNLRTLKLNNLIQFKYSNLLYIVYIINENLDNIININDCILLCIMFPLYILRNNQQDLKNYLQETDSNYVGEIEYLLDEDE